MNPSHASDMLGSMLPPQEMCPPGIPEHPTGLRGGTDLLSILPMKVSERAFWPEIETFLVKVLCSCC